MEGFAARGKEERDVDDDDDGCRASHFGYVSVSVDVEAKSKSKSRHIEGDYPAKSKGERGDEAKRIKPQTG